VTSVATFSRGGKQDPEELYEEEDEEAQLDPEQRLELDEYGDEDGDEEEEDDDDDDDDDDDVFAKRGSRKKGAAATATRKPSLGIKRKVSGGR